MRSSAFLALGLPVLHGCGSKSCTDTAQGTALVVAYTHDHQDGDHEISVTWDSQTAACTYSWAAGTPLAPTCDSGVQLWDMGNEFRFQLDDQAPPLVELAMVRSGETLYTASLTPTYTTYGGGACGEDFWGREDVAF